MFKFLLAVCPKKAKWWRTIGKVMRSWWAEAVLFIGSSNAVLVKTMVAKAAQETGEDAARGLEEKSKSPFDYKAEKRLRIGGRCP